MDFSDIYGINGSINIDMINRLEDVRVSSSTTSSIANENAIHDNPAEDPPAKKYCLQPVQWDHCYQLNASLRKLKKELDKAKEKMAHLGLRLRHYNRRLAT